MLREAEEWRQRRHEAQVERVGFLARLRRRVLGFVVERIAEQRLLWHLRKATEVSARIPADLSQPVAEKVMRGMLKRDADHHLKWLLIDLTLLLLTTPLVADSRAQRAWVLLHLPGRRAFPVDARRPAGAGGGAVDGQAAATTSPSCARSWRCRRRTRQRRFRELADRLRLRASRDVLRGRGRADARDILDRVKLGESGRALGCPARGRRRHRDHARRGDRRGRARRPHVPRQPANTPRCVATPAPRRSSRRPTVGPAPCAVLRTANPYLTFARAAAPAVSGAASGRRAFIRSRSVAAGCGRRGRRERSAPLRSSAPARASAPAPSFTRTW